MGMQMMKLVAEGIDVAEIYSPPRVTLRAKQWGLKLGWSLDLTTKDSDGKAWDFSKKNMQQRAIDKIKQDKPLLIIGSPMCTDWSTIMNFNWNKLGPEEKEKRMKNARRHLRFCVRVYRHQVSEGRYFLHEHPMGAGSWKEPNMQAMAKKEKNILAKIDQCQYGLWIKDKTGSLLAKKPTKFLTNSPGIAKHLQTRCPGEHSHVEGAHASLFDGKTAQA